MSAIPSNERRPINLGAVLLAAGASSRMGRPKLLLPWGATSVLGHLLGQWQAVGVSQIAVVCAAGDPIFIGELDRLGFPRPDRIFNSAPSRGMFSSVQAAAQWSRWSTLLTHWALVLGDQPQLSLETLRKIVAFAEMHPSLICQPSHGGRARHPVIFPRDSFQLLARSTDEHLKGFLRARSSRVALCEIDDPALDMDIDTPSDYDRAIREFLGSNPAPTFP